MIRQYDHVTLLADDLDASAANFERQGFSVTVRQDAPGGLTENRLICFADGSYIELFKFRDENYRAKHRWGPMTGPDERWADYCVLAENLPAEQARLADSSIPTSGPESLARTLADGTLWECKSLLAGRGVGSPCLPFFVEDLTEHSIRVPMTNTAHANKALGIAGCTILTADFSAVAPQLDAIFGAGPDSAADRRDGNMRVRRYAFSGRWLDLVDSATASSPLRDHLDVQGEGLYSVTFAGSLSVGTVRSGRFSLT